MNLANNLLGLVNILTFLVSIPIVILGVQLNRVSGVIGGQCFELFRLPILIIGVFIMAMSIVGIIGGCCRVSWLLWIYLFAMLLLLISLFSIYAVSFLVMLKSDSGARVARTELKEYKLSGYSEWLQNRVNDGKAWKKVKDCLVLSESCEDMPKNDTKLQEFNMHELPPILSGCCKPLSECGFRYQNPTVWIKKNTSASSNPDCKAWDNDPKAMCFNCNSCKAGILAQLIVTWRNAHLAILILLGFLMLLYSIGFCAFKNTRKKADYWRQY